MKKINFEDGTLVKNGYVEIDGVQYPVVKAQYTGKTPLSSYNLNNMQDNIETALEEEVETKTDEALNKKVVSYRNVLVDEQALIKECGGLKLKKLNKLVGKTEQEVRSGKNFAEISDTERIKQNKDSLELLSKYDGTKLTDISLETGEYIVSLVLLSKPTTATSFSNYLDNVNKDENGFVNIQNFELNKKYTKKITLTKTTQLKYAIWGNTNADLFKFQFQIEKGDIATEYEAYGKAPTPNFPSEVKTVTGEVEVKVENKNYIDITDLPNWSTSMAGGYRGKEFNLKPSTNYTISQLVDRISSTTGNKISYIFAISGKYAGGSFSSGIDGALVGKPITVKTDTNGVLTIFVSNTEIKKEYGLMLEEGTKATDYVEHQSGNYPLTLGNNAYNKKTAQVIDAYIRVTDSILRPSGDSVTMLIPCKGNTEYEISHNNSNVTIFRTGYLETEYNSVEPFSTVYSIDETANGKHTLTTSANAKYIAVQINKGYLEAVKESLKVIDTQKQNIELCKIGDYADYIYKNGSKWFKHSAISKAIFNGSENWKTATVFKGSYYLSSNNGILSGTIKYSQLFCNCFAMANISNENEVSKNYTRNTCFIETNGGAFNAWYGDDTTTVNDFKSYLSNNNAILYYILATPTDTEITDTTLIAQLNALENAQLYEGITNISITGDNLTPIADIDYWTWFKGETGEDIGNIYSTEEQRIGTWINGKPLYRKIINTLTPTTTANGTSVTKIIQIGDDIDYAFTEWGIFETSSIMNFPIPYENNAGYGIKMYRSEKAGIKISNTNVDYSNMNAYISVLYTKTTD